MIRNRHAIVRKLFLFRGMKTCQNAGLCSVVTARRNRVALANQEQPTNQPAGLLLSLTLQCAVWWPHRIIATFFSVHFETLLELVSRAGDDGSLLPEHGLIFSPKTAKFGTFRERDTHVARMSPLGKTSTWPFTTASPPQVIATVHRVQSYITAAMMRRQWWGGRGGCGASTVSATGWLHDRAIRWTCQQMDRFVKLVRLLLKRALNYIEL